MVESCPKCKSKIRQGAKFCEVCGYKILGVEGKKTLDEIEEEIRIKVETEFNEKQEKEFRERREKELRKEKQKQLKKTQRSFLKNILMITIIAVIISIIIICGIISVGIINFNQMTEDKDLSGNIEAISNYGIPFKFLKISNTPTTNHETVITYDFVNLILEFTLFAGCFFILLFVFLIIFKKVK